MHNLTPLDCYDCRPNIGRPNIMIEYIACPFFRRQDSCSSCIRFTLASTGWWCTDWCNALLYHSCCVVLLLLLADSLDALVTVAVLCCLPNVIDEQMQKVNQLQWERIVFLTMFRANGFHRRMSQLNPQSNRFRNYIKRKTFVRCWHRTLQETKCPSYIGIEVVLMMVNYVQFMFVLIFRYINSLNLESGLNFKCCRITIR